jgi:diaminopimelate decarboxylase
MHHFRYRGARLYCENVALDTLARKLGTPLYVYSERTLTAQFRRLDQALGGVDHLLCFAVKSNSNRAVLRALAALGSGFDVVSAGELERVLAAGGDPARCVFAGVGKTAAELEYALRQGIYCINAESEPELERLDRIAARLRVTAPVAVRVNPDVAAHTHRKITTGTYENKFGIAFEQVEALYARARRRKHLRLRGLQMHIGSQITEVGPFAEAARKVRPLAQRLKEAYGLEFLSLGGGLGIVYQDALASGAPAWWRSPRHQQMLTPEKYAARLLPIVAPLGLRLLLEPGRFIVGNAGVLLTRVEYLKRTGRKTFIIVDAAMNDLIRPAFYDAYHEIVPLTRAPRVRVRADVVGPVCESGDLFCHDRLLPAVREGEYLALMSAGAYSFAMASNYNSRPLAAEVLVRGRQAALVRPRQPSAQVWAGETMAPWQRQEQ